MTEQSETTQQEKEAILPDGIGFTCTNCSNMVIQALERVTNMEQLTTLMNKYKEAITQQKAIMAGSRAKPDGFGSLPFQR